MVPQDSAKFWFPKLQSARLSEWLPNTILIDYNEDMLAASLMGKHTAEYERLYYAVQAAIRYEIAGPAFIRTDITSAKHAGSRAWKVETEDDLNDALLTTLSASQLKTYHQRVKASAIMVRPLLQIAGRTAFGGLPIGKEYRIFADQRGIQCWHNYWPDEALTGKMDDGNVPPPAPTSWMMNTDVLDAAERAAFAMGQGKWSIDFAEDKFGNRWLLDMATAENSYHAPCQFQHLDMQERL
jgi:hypothetical protein